ncbi:hypothetical protein D5125_09335 [Magnetovirga frankeli]|uniref:hypothetical protein n=1 Tax=Magnetovirga frankeli TaxID=947516 RepID=UPI0012934D40|nr:hypothetical protein D5125_09335 [gamma proteobacterium SS-5]
MSFEFSIEFDLFSAEPDVMVYEGTIWNDWIYGSIDDDDIYGYAGDDDLDGGLGDDFIDGGAGNDLLFGDWGSDILIGGAGDDRIVASIGSDEYYGGTEHDSSNAWDEIDTVYYSNAFSPVHIEVASAENNLIYVDAYSAAGGHMTHVLQDIERIEFDAFTLAYDLDGNAGDAVRLIGAVYGAAEIDNLATVGYYLDYLDTGYSFEAVMGYALDDVGAYSNEDVVDLLYFNLAGCLPSFDVQDQFVDLLEDGLFSQEELAVFAADLQLNALNIDLAGLAYSGIEYV